MPALTRLAALGLCALLFSAAAEAQQAAEPMRRTITVSGQGEVSATPDQARLTAGVLTQAMTATDALDANTKAMSAVFAAIKRLGISDNKIRTSNFSLVPQYPPIRQELREPRAIAGYQVSNQVTVVLDDVSKTGATLDALIRSGANQSGSVGFEIADPRPLADRARRAAVENAIAKARILADAAGVSLGPILSIQDGGGGEAPVPFARTFAVAAAAPPPIATGEQTVSVSVTITYAIQ